MLLNILCGVFGFLVGSAGVSYGARKKNPVSFGVGLAFLLAGVAAFFSALIFRAAVEEELDEDEFDPEPIEFKKSEPAPETPADEPAPEPVKEDDAPEDAE